jgi:hypothetical protein
MQTEHFYLCTLYAVALNETISKTVSNILDINLCNSIYYLKVLELLFINYGKHLQSEKCSEKL